MPSTERERKVAEAVFDLATRTHECDVLDLLHDLTTYLVALLGIRAAGATILNEVGQVDYLTASDEVCRRLEQDQFELDEGPCVDSTRSGEVLFPTTLHRVAAVPLRAGDHTLGAVNLMSASRAAPTSRDLGLAQVLADAAGAWLSQRRALQTKDEIVDQLQAALNGRIVIEQAKGVLAATLGIDVEEAFQRLRAHARDRRVNLADLAARVARGEIPAELITPL